MTADWDARSYDRVADPQYGWGLEVLDRLELSGTETVLDAGCGSGRVTEALLERLPAGGVIAFDMSPAMVEAARRRLARFGGRVRYLVGDLQEPIPLEAPVDAVLSTATFHWVLDHDRLFRNLADVMRPGAMLAAQCGGYGNVARFEAAVAELAPTVRRRYRFETAEATADRLARCGFTEIRTWLTEASTRFDPGEPFEAFLETVCLRQVLPQVPPEERSTFARRVADRLGEPVLDYVRLNILARRVGNALSSA